MNDALLEEICSMGSWSVHFQPVIFEPKKIPSIVDCKDLIKKSSVELRGWDYPHIPRERDGIVTGQDYVEGRVDWDVFKEVWRFYQSGQFIHAFAINEDLHKEMAKSYRLPPGFTKYLSITGTVYQVTEMFELLRRLAGSGIYDQGVKIKIKLSGLQNRVLVSDRGRGTLFGNYAAKIDKYTYEKTLSRADIDSKHLELAREAIVEFFNRFNWENQPQQVFAEDQKKLLERRI